MTQENMGAEKQDEAVIVDDTQVENTGDVQAETTELEEFQKTESEDSMPVASHIKVKRKLKGKLDDANDRISKLEQQVAQKKEQPEIAEHFPQEFDFDTTDEYQEAVNAYHNNKYKAVHDKAEQDRLNDIAKQQHDKEVNEHYARVNSELIDKHSINPDNYNKAEENFLTALETSNPQQGQMILENCMKIVGQGSEKVIYNLGINKTRQNEFLNLLNSDPTGLKAAAYLGGLKSQLTKTKQTTSNASKPATIVKGQQGTTQSGADLKKQYNDLHKVGDASAAWAIKSKAKQQGIDTKEW